MDCRILASAHSSRLSWGIQGLRPLKPSGTSLPACGRQNCPASFRCRAAAAVLRRGPADRRVVHFLARMGVVDDAEPSFLKDLRPRASAASLGSITPPKSRGCAGDSPLADLAAPLEELLEAEGRVQSIRRRRILLLMWEVVDGAGEASRNSWVGGAGDLDPRDRRKIRDRTRDGEARLGKREDDDAGAKARLFKAQDAKFAGKGLRGRWAFL